LNFHVIENTPYVYIYKRNPLLRMNATNLHYFIDTLQIATILNSTYYCQNYKAFSDTLCKSLNVDRCIILDIGSNKCYRNICLCDNQQFEQNSIVYYEVKHVFVDTLNNSALPAWVNSVTVLGEDDISPIPFIIVSILCALCGLCVVLSGIQVYHRYFGYTVVKKDNTQGADTTTQRLLRRVPTTDPPPPPGTFSRTDFFK